MISVSESPSHTARVFSDNVLTAITSVVDVLRRKLAPFEYPEPVTPPVNRAHPAQTEQTGDASERAGDLMGLLVTLLEGLADD